MRRKCARRTNARVSKTPAPLKRACACIHQFFPPANLLGASSVKGWPRPPRPQSNEPLVYRRTRADHGRTPERLVVRFGKRRTTNLMKVGGPLGLNRHQPFALLLLPLLPLSECPPLLGKVPRRPDASNRKRPPRAGTQNTQMSQLYTPTPEPGRTIQREGGTPKR